MQVIYKIINLKTKKFYLGSTTNFKKRKARHLYDLRRKTHHSLYLQRSFDKYGENNFLFEVVQECTNCLEEEQSFLNSLNFEECYNVSRNANGGDNFTNHPNKEILRLRLIEILKNNRHKIKPRFGSENPNWKGGKVPFCKCGNKMSFNAKTCSKCQNKKGENNSFFNKHHTLETKTNLSNTMKQRGYVGLQEKIVLIDNKEYKSISEAARQLKVTPSTIINRIRNKNFPTYLYKECLETIEKTDYSGTE